MTSLRLLVLATSFLLGLRAAAAPLVLQLDWRYNAQFAGLIVAAERGYFREAGLEVELRDLGALPYDQLGPTVAAQADWVGSIEAGLLLSNRAAGHDLVALGTMFQASPLGLITLASSGIETPAQLRGKRVLIHADGREALAALLHREGIDRSTLTIGEGGYGMADLLAGQCDAKQGYLVDELVKLRLEGHPARAFAYRDYGYKAYSQVYVTSRATLERRRGDLQRLLAAAARGWAEAVRDPAATALLLHATRARDLDPAYLEASLREIIPLLTAESPRLGAMSRESWQEQVEHYLQVTPGARLDRGLNWVVDLGAP